MNLKQVSAAVLAAGALFTSGWTARSWATVSELAPQGVIAQSVGEVTPGFAVACNGTPIVCEADYLYTPTPIIPAETATPTRTPTRQPSVTPTKFTPSPSPTLPPYPYWEDIRPDGARYRVLVPTLRIRNQPQIDPDALVVGSYTQNQMPLLRCLFHRSASEVWGSEQTCHSPGSYWSAVQIGAARYMEIVQE